MKKEIRIGHKMISENSPCFIISEIGANHNNSLELAKKLIDLSVDAGFDAVKFQSYKAETLYSRYLKPKVNEDGSLGPNPFELIKSIEMSFSWHQILKDYCDSKNIIFLSSPFDFEAVDDLEKVNVPAYKIASSELSDPLLVKYIASKGKPIILSTGKANLKEVEEAVEWITSTGNDQIILLHCTVSYPAVYESMNLKAMDTLKEKFNCLVGLSDHNEENLTAVAAIAMGAKMIEKHVTLDKKMPGPDHAFALNPDGFKELVSWVRKTESSMGTGIKAPHTSELLGRERGNRSIHLKRNLAKGEVIKLEDLIIKRPAYGIHGRELENVIGKVLVKDVLEDMWLTWEDLNETK
jgi:sialic acid synthase SpsE